MKKTIAVAVTALALSSLGGCAAVALTAAGVQRVLVHEKLFERGVYVPLIAGIEANPMLHLETVSADHLGEVRVYAFLPGFGREGAP